MKKRVDGNPMRDGWRPADKAAEAAVDNPLEFGGGPRTKQATVAPAPRQSVESDAEEESTGD